MLSVWEREKEVRKIKSLYRNTLDKSTANGDGRSKLYATLKELLPTSRYQHSWLIQDSSSPPHVLFGWEPAFWGLLKGMTRQSEYLVPPPDFPREEVPEYRWLILSEPNLTALSRVGFLNLCLFMASCWASSGSCVSLSPQKLGS